MKKVLLKENNVDLTSLWSEIQNVKYYLCMSLYKLRSLKNFREIVGFHYLVTRNHLYLLRFDKFSYTFFGTLRKKPWQIAWLMMLT